MRDFVFHIPTQVVFGKTCLEQLVERLLAYGTRPLLVYGGGSVRRIGLYDRVTGILNQAGISFDELAGVEPNPRVDTVRKGVLLCQERRNDVVLALGGGSVIDCAKAIAACASQSEDPWDIISGKCPVQKVLPVLSVLTMAGTGSEMSTYSVISNLQLNKKVVLSHPDMRCKVAFLDPTITYSLPQAQTCAGIADAFSHAMESYFSNVPEARLQARFGESIMHTLYHAAQAVLKDPADYEARSNIMWASTWAINGLLELGNPVGWSMHAIEHELSAYYDITHGLGLGILIPAWMRWMLREENAYRYKEYVHAVFGVNTDNMTNMEAAEAAISKTAEFMQMLGMPAHLSDVGVEKDMLSVMANNIGDTRLSDAFVPLTARQILEIYELAY